MGRKNRHVVNTEFPLLDELNLYPSNTGGDGNCLFRALSDQTFGDETHHAEIRHNVVSYVEKHGDHFSAFVGEFGETFEHYIQRLYQDGVYGGHIEIVGFVESYAKQVVVYQAENMYILEPQNVSSADWTGTAHLAYHTWEHYSSVRPKAGPHSGPVAFPVPEAISLSRPTESGGQSQSTTIPPWKIEIVLRSVPDAPESQIAKMLQTKDLDTVIEELLMQSYEEPEMGGGGNIDGGNEPHIAGITSEVATASRPLEEPHAPPVKDPTTKASKDPTPKASKKQLAKDRRQEKKERARRKKTSRVAQQHGTAPSGEDGSEASPSIKRVIHI